MCVWYVFVRAEIALTHSHKHTLSLSLKYTYTHTHTLSLSLSLSLSLFENKKKGGGRVGYWVPQTSLCKIEVKVACLQEAKQYALHILANVAGLVGKARGCSSRRQ